MRVRGRFWVNSGDCRGMGMGMEMEAETLEHHDSVGFQMSGWNLWYLLEIDDERCMLAYDFSLFRVLDQELACKSTNLFYYIFFIFKLFFFF